MAENVESGFPTQLGGSDMDLELPAAHLWDVRRVIAGLSGGSATPSHGAQHGVGGGRRLLNDAFFGLEADKYDLPSPK
jgi:hypothetical protein